jgi:hypothetical protein
MFAARDVVVPKSTNHNTFVFPSRNKTTTQTSDSNFQSGATGATKELSIASVINHGIINCLNSAVATGQCGVAFVAPGTNDKLGIAESYDNEESSNDDGSSVDDNEESSNDDGSSVDESVEYEDDEDATSSICIGGKWDKANVKPNSNDAELLNIAMNMPAQEICVSLRVYMLFVGFYLLPTSLTCRMML